jgi:hypothetical protein
MTDLRLLRECYKMNGGLDDLLKNKLGNRN